MTSVETPEQYEKFRSRARELNSLLNYDGKNPIPAWLPISRLKNGTWLDIYTSNTISSEWNEGFPVNESKKDCGIGSLGLINFECQYTGGMGGFYCTCDFADHPFLTLRGLCKSSNLDQTYLPQNSPLDGETTYYGNRKSIARFKKEDFQWKIDTFVYNTTAVSKEIAGRFMLGKQNWTIEGDSKKCYEGKPYNVKLKLTGCKLGEFTCDDGQCIEMEKRCDQVTGKKPNCRDESDENGCQLIKFKENYKRNIPPVDSATDGSVIPANVSISITLLKVVEIEETEHSIHLQFEITLMWKENRVTYQNLKTKTSLNALTKQDISKLWLPLVIYSNTDQKESTRLGMEWEWLTRVSVVKEGNLSRSGVDEVDEAEIFEGADNNLIMTQTYTREFRCQYKLEKYPFDTQVTMIQNPIHIVYWLLKCNKYNQGENHNFTLIGVCHEVDCREPDQGSC